MRHLHVVPALAMAASLAGPVNAETVRIAGFGGSDPVVVNGLLTEVLADDLEAAGIEVEYTPVEGDFSQFITNALSAGTAPDLFYVDIFWSDAIFGAGQAAPVADPAVAEAMLPNLVEAFTRDGQLLGVPKDFNTLAVHYNADIFEDAGVEPPDADDTWDDFAEKLRTVEEELGDVAGICVVPDYARFGPFALAAGWQPFNEEGRTVLDDNFRRAFEWYTGLVTEGGGAVAADQGEGWTGGCLVNEKAAVAIEGAWIIGAIRDGAPSMVWGTAPMPIDPETGQRGNLLFTVAWVVNANSPVAEQAHQLAQMLTSEEAQQWVLEQGLAIPSRSALAENPFLAGDSNAAVASRVVFEGAQDGVVQPYYFNQYGGAWMEPINSAINAVILGQSDVDTALAEAQERLDQITGHQQ